MVGEDVEGAAFHKVMETPDCEVNSQKFPVECGISCFQFSQEVGNLLL